MILFGSVLAAMEVSVLGEKASPPLYQNREEKAVGVVAFTAAPHTQTPAATQNDPPSPPPVRATNDDAARLPPGSPDRQPGSASHTDRSADQRTATAPR